MPSACSQHAAKPRSEPQHWERVSTKGSLQVVGGIGRGVGQAQVGAGQPIGRDGQAVHCCAGLDGRQPGLCVRGSHQLRDTEAFTRAGRLGCVIG